MRRDSRTRFTYVLQVLLLVTSISASYDTGFQLMRSKIPSYIRSGITGLDQTASASPTNSSKSTHPYFSISTHSCRIFLKHNQLLPTYPHKSLFSDFTLHLKIKLKLLNVMYKIKSVACLFLQFSLIIP